jgi:hypothetical protein
LNLQATSVQPELSKLRRQRKRQATVRQQRNDSATNSQAAKQLKISERQASNLSRANFEQELN